MDKNVLLWAVVAFLVVLLILMYLGWQARRRRQASLPATRPVPATVGDEFFRANVFYVATTLAGEPLNRVAVNGLGFRARAEIIVASEGIVLAIPGQPQTWLPANDLRGVDRATWTIDRVVERDGLVLVAWDLVDDDTRVSVDSYLRFASAAEVNTFSEAVTRLLHNSASHSSTQGGLA